MCLPDGIAAMQGVAKWGHRAAVRIPASVLGAAQVGLDRRVDAREEGGADRDRAAGGRVTISTR